MPNRPVARSKLEAEGDLIVFTNQFGPGVGIGTNGGSAKASGHGFGKIFFHLFYEQDGVTNTDLYFDGLNANAFHSSVVISNNTPTTFDIYNQQAPVTGDGTFNHKWTVITGKVTISGKSHGGIPEPGLPLPPTNPPPPEISSP